ncbi:MAG: hypothetical protein AAF787_00190 [Chloroflexota bacterium]
MNWLDSDLDGRMVFSEYPAPGWFGVIIGILEDGSQYAVENLMIEPPEDRPVMMLPAEDIESYLADTLEG